MSYEVELKFPLTEAAHVVRQLQEMGVRAGRTVSQQDIYFAHPARDFAQTDEALRIRTTDDELRMTYKGPLVDAQTKTRREIELPVGTGADDADALGELLQALGFRPVRTVAKTRTHYHLTADGRKLEFVHDRIDGLGEFLEIETQADEQDRDAARDVILDYAHRLGLTQSERRSYLQLLLERDGLA